MDDVSEIFKYGCYIQTTVLVGYLLALVTSYSETALILFITQFVITFYFWLTEGFKNRMKHKRVLVMSMCFLLNQVLVSLAQYQIFKVSGELDK